MVVESKMVKLGKNVFGGNHYSIPGCVSLGFPFLDPSTNLKPFDSLTDETGHTLHVFLCPCCHRISLIHFLPSMLECCCKPNKSTDFVTA